MRLLSVKDFINTVVVGNKKPATITTNRAIKNGKFSFQTAQIGVSYFIVCDKNNEPVFKDKIKKNETQAVLPETQKLKEEITDLKVRQLIFKATNAKKA